LRPETHSGACFFKFWFWVLGFFVSSASDLVITWWIHCPFIHSFIRGEEEVTVVFGMITNWGFLCG
jgi:hypothetical protein